eukprot:5019728-Pleurochrysis_carterae.AAC.1
MFRKRCEDLGGGLKAGFQRSSARCSCLRCAVRALRACYARLHSLRASNHDEVQARVDLSDGIWMTQSCLPFRHYGIQPR